MKMNLRSLLVGVLLLSCFSLSKADVSQNLIDPQAWEGVTYGADPGGCCASISGNGPLYDTNTGVIMFSYGNALISQTIAINQALKAIGIQVDGYQYHWHYKLMPNNAGSSDSLTFEVSVKDSNGQVVETYTYNYSGPADGLDVHQAGTQMFNQSYMDPQSIALKIRGQDGGFWGGYYGPEITYTDLRLIYSVDPCGGDPLFDPSCNGYAEALAKQLYDQNCAANPLYDTGCPGYQTAYFNQQCSISPLYNQACPGYTEAYYNQQCSANPLYDSQCPGYAQAYEDQQCKLDPLFSTNCTGYQEAYHSQQCSLNALYTSDCPGYAEAYFNQQCGINALYNNQCPGYAEAYATKMLLEKQEEETSGTIAESEPVTIAVDPIASLTTVSSTGDAVVDSVISAPVAVVSLTEQVTSNEPQTESISDSSAAVEEPMGDSGGEDSGGSEAGPDEKEDNATGGDSKSGTSSNSTRDKVKKAMTEKAMALADDMSNAATIEAQKAVQAQVLAVMGYVPGFGAYGGTIGGGSYSDAQMYAPTTVPESKRGLRNGLAQQLLHTKIVDSQYKESD
jgi:hypothetical protein